MLARKGNRMMEISRIGRYAGRLFILVALAIVQPLAAGEPNQPGWILGQAFKIPSQFTNQESGYFSIVEGHNGQVYIGAAKYGVDAYLIEFDPKTSAMRMVVDVHQLIGSKATGFAAQAKIHTRNNVGASGKIYFGSKQGYPEKGEKWEDYPGGYPCTYDPATGKAEHFGIPIPHHGIISVAPDEARGVAYLSTCADQRPIEHAHFMILNLTTRKYRDLGDMEIAYAFVVIDARGRAYHPIRGGLVARYNPSTNRLERLTPTLDGGPLPALFKNDDTILNWEVSPDRKTLYAVEMSTNQLYAFDLSGDGLALPGRSLGALLPGAKTDCRALAVAPDGTVWAAVSHADASEGSTLHLVGYRPGQSAPRDFGIVGIANPHFTPFTDAAGKPLPWHHTIRKAKDGTLSPWVPMGVCGAKDGSVYVMTIAPFTLIRIGAEKVSRGAEKQ